MEDSKSCWSRAHSFLEQAEAEQLPQVRRKLLASAARWLKLGRHALAVERKRSIECLARQADARARRSGRTRSAV